MRICIISLIMLLLCLFAAGCGLVEGGLLYNEYFVDPSPSYEKHGLRSNEMYIIHNLQQEIIKLQEEREKIKKQIETLQNKYDQEK